MENLIPVINKLQDVFNAVGTDPIDLPQIVVVGSQSSGKSSVLENIVGRDFLPRGAGIVTRRPLVLQLNHLPADVKPSVDREWGEFLHKPNDMFYDFQQIKEEIVRETERLTGRNKGVSPQPINLKVYSPHVLNLTLVDLPGMTKVPVGDQPSDIELQIRRMIMSYVERPNAIILAVTPANSDLATSDALQLAREVDPEGLRTIGVITKIDLMDRGTDAMDVLLGKVIPLKHGYIGVVNRSQQDIISKKDIRTAQREETNYFMGHPMYRTIASKLGTAFLAKTLNKLLMQHIKECLPELRAKINKLVVDAQMEMMQYGDPMLDSRNSQGALLLQILTKFSGDYRDVIDGKLTDWSVQELQGGARINYIFNDIFVNHLHQINPADGLTLNDIRTAIRNATGTRAPLFIPEMSFDSLVRRQIARLEEPSLQCAELVFEELQRIVAQLETKDLARFPSLRERVVEVMSSLLQQCRKPAKEMIANLISIEHSYINTSHPDFIGGGGAVTTLLEHYKSQAEREQNPFTPPVPKAVAAPTPAQPQPPVYTPPASTVSTSPPVQPSGFFNIFFGGGSGGGGASAQSYMNNLYSKDNKSGAQNGRPQSATKPSTKIPTNATPTTGTKKLPQVPSTIKASTSPSDREKFETELIQSLLVSYFNIVLKNISDTVPKSIIHFLVNKSKETVQNELVRALYKEELFEELLAEAPAVAAKRLACKTNLELLQKAQEIINEVRDSAV